MGLQWTEEQQGEAEEEESEEDNMKTPGRESKQLDPAIRQALVFLLYWLVAVSKTQHLILVLLWKQPFHWVNPAKNLSNWD